MKRIVHLEIEKSVPTGTDPAGATAIACNHQADLLSHRLTRNPSKVTCEQCKKYEPVLLDLSDLSELQACHVRKVFPEQRAEMAKYLREGTAVVVRPQNECIGDVAPYAIAVVSHPEFWIDCANSVAEGEAQALALGLNVIQ
jgi:hypothetical protein